MEKTMDKDDFALLKVIASTMESVKDDVREIKDSLKGKVEHADFASLKIEVEDLKKSKWMTLGFAGAVSFIISHFWK